LNKSIDIPFKAFEKGFNKVVSGSAVIKMIKSNELMKIINGSEVLDFDSLEKKCNYENGYTKDTPVC
jgi:hypothetical protein